MKNFPGVLFVAIVAASAVFAQSSPRPAAPVEPVGAILDAFRTHALVALADEHGNEQGSAFRIALIRDPRFASLVNDIVVEFGNARYQGLIDRFVRGEDVRDEDLRRVWQDTTQVEYEWDLPIYEAFFRAVRQVNAALPRERQLRVLLGDPPIEWENVRTRDDLIQWLDIGRDAHAVTVIRREVLDKGRHALVIYGGSHLLRKNAVIGAADEWAGGLVAQLEKSGITSVFTVIPETRRDLRSIQSDVASWPMPSLAKLRGTQLGAANYSPSPQQRRVNIEEQFDAILYLGPPASASVSRLLPALCTQPGYLEMRLSRLSLIGPPANASISPADSLKAYCANANANGDVEISDNAPVFTEHVRQAIREAAAGDVSPNLIAPESRDQLIPRLEEIGKRYLISAGEIRSLTLLEDAPILGGYRNRRYRAVFASGQKVVWSVRFSLNGEIVGMDPRPE
jgi:hypothetical protein